MSALPKNLVQRFGILLLSADCNSEACHLISDSNRQLSGYLCYSVFPHVQDLSLSPPVLLHTVAEDNVCPYSCGLKMMYNECVL